MVRMYKFACFILILSFLTSCSTLHKSSKYEFRDGIYQTKLVSKTKHEVYVFKIDDDSIIVCPVIEYPDSTAVLVKQKTIYTGLQKKIKDGYARHIFYKNAFDIDAITLPLLFRPARDGIPNQLVTNFNGALYLGYRTDAYILDYARTPFNSYKQNIKHYGVSSGLFLGASSTFIDNNSIRNIYIDRDYEGVTLIYGLGINMAIENINFGLALGWSDLLDKYGEYWIYQGKPFIGFTLGISLN